MFNIFEESSTSHVDPSYCSKKLKNLYDFWRTLEIKKQNSGLYKQKKQDFIYELNNLFDITQVNAMTIIIRR